MHIRNACLLWARRRRLSFRCIVLIAELMPQVGLSRRIPKVRVPEGSDQSVKEPTVPLSLSLSPSVRVCVCVWGGERDRESQWTSAEVTHDAHAQTDR